MRRTPSGDTGNSTRGIRAVRAIELRSAEVRNARHNKPSAPPFNHAVLVHEHVHAEASTLFDPLPHARVVLMVARHKEDPVRRWILADRRNIIASQLTEPSTQSPVNAIMSGFNDCACSTIPSTNSRLMVGPTWMSLICAMRNPSNSGGSPERYRHLLDHRAAPGFVETIAAGDRRESDDADVRGMDHESTALCIGSGRRPRFFAARFLRKLHHKEHTVTQQHHAQDEREEAQGHIPGPGECIQPSGLHPVDEEEKGIVGRRKNSPTSTQPMVRARPSSRAARITLRPRYQ